MSSLIFNSYPKCPSCNEGIMVPISDVKVVGNVGFILPISKWKCTKYGCRHEI